ncbi:MAG TPA: SusC/RagA family TonB-linked outer membrane protein, partial [Bacteroidetes bacterium]|nr:SusC/RagA family TonB-linked outer membrane protein [Bacteroidota bacterium]
FFDNPFFILKENRNSFGRDRIFGNIVATYDLNENFSFSLRNGMDYSNELRRFRRAFSSNRFKNGAYAEHSIFFREINSDFLLNYREKLGDLSLEVSLGGNRMDQQGAAVQIQALSLAQPGIFKLSNAASPLEVFDFESHKRINSFYGIAKLGYRDFLYLDITGRNDWSSALATPVSAQNTSFFYPSVSSSFVLSNAIELPKVINFAKLRLSWAQVGNDTDPFQTAGVFQAQTPYNGQPTFSDQSTIASSALLPERTTSIEFGTDLRFLSDRIRLDATYYDATTKNQIISLPIPVSSGYTERVVNGGAVRSRGLEIVLGITPIANKDFRWNTTFNFSRNIATVESLPTGTGTLTLAYSRVYDNVNQTVWFQVQEGGRIGEMYGTGYLKNENGDFVIDANGKYIVNNELILLGNYNPDFILGMGNNFRYKNFDLSFLLDWRKGGALVSRTLALAGVAGQLIETESRPDAGIIAQGVVNVGTDENPVWEANTTAIPAETYYRQYYDRNHEENNVYNASYLKLREFSLGYTFKPDTEEGFFRNGRTLRLAFVGRNLFAISQIPHFDPEQLAVQGQKYISGVEDMSYATSRSLGIKIGLNF